MLGEALGLDWSSFHATPRSFGQPGNSAELVIAAAWTLLATDFGTVQDACSLLQSDAELCRAIQAYGRPGEGLNQALFDMVSAYTSRTQADWDELEATAYYDDGVVSWATPIELTYIQDDPMTVSPLLVASVMVHEASHGFLDPHTTDCTQISPCDVDGSGAYGASVMTLGLRFLNELQTDSVQCEDDLVDLLLTCNNRIVDGADVPPCQMAWSWSC